MDKQVVFNGFLWRLFERIGAQSVSFVVSIVLARILGPTVYGTIALVTVVMTVLQVFTDGGFGNALIQKKDSDDLDFSTVFFFNVVFSCLIYLFLFLCAPLISNFYSNKELTPIVRVLGINLLISSVKNIQQAYVTKNMIFKKFFFATLGGTIGAAIIGISFALLGFGVWALVLQGLFNVAVDTIILWITVKWRPKKQFSFRRLSSLFSYGWKLLVSSLVNTGFAELRQLIIGKKYSADDLAYYSKGRSFPQLIVSNVYSAVDSVSFSAMASLQDQKEQLRNVTRRVITVNAFVMIPMLIGMAAIADTMINVLLGDDWAFSIPFVRIFCFSNLFYPINVSNRNVLRSLGRSDLLLRNEIICDSVGLVTILLTMNISVLAISLGVLVSALFGVIINSWDSKRLIGYSFFLELKDISKTLLLALFMGSIVFFMQNLRLPVVLLLVLQLMVGAIIYLAGAWALKLEELQFGIGLIKNIFIRNQNDNKE